MNSKKNSFLSCEYQALFLPCFISNFPHFIIVVSVCILRFFKLAQFYFSERIKWTASVGHEAKFSYSFGRGIEEDGYSRKCESLRKS